MSVTRAEVERIAELARLRLDDAELERLTGELNGILEHVAALGGLPAHEDVEATDATTHLALASTRPTEDAEPDPLGAGPGAFAPRWTDGFFTVPAPPGVHHEEVGE